MENLDSTQGVGNLKGKERSRMNDCFLTYKSFKSILVISSFYPAETAQAT